MERSVLILRCPYRRIRFYTCILSRALNVCVPLSASVGHKTPSEMVTSVVMYDIMLTFWWPSCYVGWSAGIVCGALFDPWCRRVVLGATLAVLKLMCVFRSSEGQEPYVYQTFSKLFPPPPESGFAPSYSLQNESVSTTLPQFLKKPISWEKKTSLFNLPPFSLSISLLHFASSLSLSDVSLCSSLLFGCLQWWYVGRY